MNITGFAFILLSIALIIQAYYSSLLQLRKINKIQDLQTMDETRLKEIEETNDRELLKLFKKFETEGLLARGNRQYASTCREKKTYIVDLDKM